MYDTVSLAFSECWRLAGNSAKTVALVRWPRGDTHHLHRSQSQGAVTMAQEAEEQMPSPEDIYIYMCARMEGRSGFCGQNNANHNPAELQSGVFAAAWA
eukprot:2802969-Amphidinium_carterae.1